MAGAVNRKWALDTNVVLDLAAEVEAAKALMEIAQEKGYSLHVTQRVMIELADLSINALSAKGRLQAGIALRKIQEWKIAELPSAPTFTEIATSFSSLARASGLLPEAEINDGVILAEASLGGAALLISSDAHLLNIDPDELRLFFESRDMVAIPTVSPAKVCKLFGGADRITGRY